VTLDSVVDDGTWRVSVEDEGPGLTAEQRQQIFERFVRFGPACASDRGSGLGLAISRSIVELHKGRIFATNRRESPGLRVVVEIPTT